MFEGIYDIISQILGPLTDIPYIGDFIAQLLDFLAGLLPEEQV